MNESESKFNLSQFDSRLNNWRHDLVDQIQTSATDAINSHAGNINVESMSDTQKMESEMGKVMETALLKVDQMKEHGIDEDKIREAILPAIQNMASPHGDDTTLNARFGQFKEDAFNRVDAQIIGNDQVFRRNMRI